MKIRERRSAYWNPTPSNARHMRRLVGEESMRRSTRKRRRATRGQTLLIFALTFTVLIGFMGLAIDSIRVYDMYARMQRAAEAGALAGVIYMPTNYTTNLPTSPGDNAVCRAWQEVYKDSFGSGCTPGSSIGANYCPTPLSATEIAVCPVRNQQYQLSVTITESINVLFLGALNVGPLQLSVTATAAFTPPLSLAVDPTNPGGSGVLSTIPFCNGVNCNGRPWSVNINGPAELKEQGDPFVTCEGGNANSQTPDPGASSYANYPGQTYTGMRTNLPLYSQTVGNPPGTCTAGLARPIASNSAYLTANPDYANQPFSGAIYNDGTSSPPTHKGYSYFVSVTTDQSSIYVWNAPFDPGAPASCNGRNWNPDGFFPCPSQATYSSYPGSDYASKGLADPKLYFATTYSIYQLNDGPANPAATTYIGSFTALPYYNGGGCATQLLPSPAYKVKTAQCVTSQCVTAWCPIGNQVGDTTVPTPITLAPGYYRLTVVSSSYYDQGFDLGWGQHGYGLEICPPGSSAQPCNGSTPAGQISSWGTMDALLLFPGKGQGQAQHTGMPLGVFSSALAGRTIDVGLFDAGDLYGNNGALSVTTGVAIVPTVNNNPDPCLESTTDLQAAGYDTTVNGSTFSFPSWERATTMSTVASAPGYPGIATSINGDRAYNGLWVHELITLPANYTETAWSVCAWGPGVDSDVMGISATSLGQSPVHLIH